MKGLIYRFDVFQKQFCCLFQCVLMAYLQYHDEQQLCLHELKELKTINK